MWMEFKERRKVKEVLGKKTGIGKKEKEKIKKEGK